MVKEYYASDISKGIHSAGQTSDPRPSRFSKKFAIMHFAADIRAARQLPPLNVPAVTDVHPGFSIEFHEPTSYLLTSKASPIPTTYTIFSPNALVSLSYLMGTSSEDLLSLVLEPSGDGYIALFEAKPHPRPLARKSGTIATT